MSEFRGDYLGFSFGTKPDGSPMHSSDLGIVRTSDGSRFNENLLPTMQDKTVQIPGGDGTYYFGSYYTQKQFNVPFAFDGLTEQQLENLKRHFGDKQVHDLIFDEKPYKIYRAKVTGTATLKYIPFAEGETNRIYKGDGTIQFTCYEPFARCKSTDPADYITKVVFGADKPYQSNKYYYLNTATNKFELDSGTSSTTNRTYYSNIGNINEWWEASHIADGGNFGNVPVPFTKILTTASGSLNTTKPVNNIQTTDKTITWSDLPLVYKITTTGADGATITTEYDARGVLNTRTGVVKQQYNHAAEGQPADWRDTGIVLNKCFIGDLTAKIPVGGDASGATFTCLYI